MSWVTIGLAILSMEAFRAENKIMRTLAVKPQQVVEGPLVSVIIPAYNEERYLPGLLTGLENQSYFPIEAIVVDNLSSDSTIQVARDYGAKVASNPIPAALSLSRNIGARASRGEILVFIDADCVPESRVIEKSVDTLIAGADLVYTNKACTDSHLQSLMRVAAGWLDPKHMTATGGYLATTRQAFNAVGGFDETYIATERSGEDGAFVRAIEGLGGKIEMLRSTYVATSARRQKAEGYVVSKHFQSRAVRGIEQYNGVRQVYP